LSLEKRASQLAMPERSGNDMDLDRDDALIDFEPRDLVSRSGFEEGEMLGDLCAEIRRREGVVIGARHLLTLVLRNDVLPLLTPPVRCRYRGGDQNPVRAKHADGELMRASEVPGSWPSVVAVPVDMIVDRAIDNGVRFTNWDAEGDREQLDAA
jgi:hypothetical protein